MHALALHQVTLHGLLRRPVRSSSASSTLEPRLHLIPQILTSSAALHSFRLFSLSSRSCNSQGSHLLQLELACRRPMTACAYSRRCPFAAAPRPVATPLHCTPSGLTELEHISAGKRAQSLLSALGPPAPIFDPTPGVETDEYQYYSPQDPPIPIVRQYSNLGLP